MRGLAFFAYADNYLIDVKFGIIVDVEASRAIRQAEVGAAKAMIERTEERLISSRSTLPPIRPMARPRRPIGLSMRRGSRRTFRQQPTLRTDINMRALSNARSSRLKEPSSRPDLSAIVNPAQHL
jgi:hypothetical protein